MIGKRLKKLSKLGILIGIRQAYFLGRNIYELYYQPYLTIKEIVDKKDKSQIFLITVAALTPTLTYVLLRIGWDLIKYHRMLIVTGNVFLVMALIQTIVIAYLGYWTWKVWNLKFKI